MGNKKSIQELEERNLALQMDNIELRRMLKNVPKCLRYIKHLSMRCHHLVTIFEVATPETGITFQCMEILNTCGISTLVHFVMLLTIV